MQPARILIRFPRIFISHRPPVSQKLTQYTAISNRVSVGETSTSADMERRAEQRITSHVCYTQESSGVEWQYRSGQ